MVEFIIIDIINKWLKWIIYKLILFNSIMLQKCNKNVKKDYEMSFRKEKYVKEPKEQTLGSLLLYN